MVSIAETLPKVTLTGPLCLVHWIVRVSPIGNPSSETVPSSATSVGRMIVWLGPALTYGNWVAAVTVTLKGCLSRPCVSV